MISLVPFTAADDKVKLVPSSCDFDDISCDPDPIPLDVRELLVVDEGVE